MEEIVEGTLSTLHILSRDSYTRAIIRQQLVVPVFIQLLYHQNVNIQRAAAGVLCEISGDKEGAEMITQEGASSILSDLLSSRSEGR